MELVDELRDLRTHHGEDMGSRPGGEGVNASPRYHDERPFSDFVAYAVAFDLQLPVDADERLVAAMMDMEGSLITFVRVELPVADNEVFHGVGV